MKQELSIAQANLKLAIWNAETESVKSSDLYIELQELGLPEEVVSRLHQLLTYTQKVAGKVFFVGKIMLLKIIEFVKTHPFLVVGFGIGAVIGSAIASLVISIPFIGQLLTPVAVMLGVTITAVGAVVGHRLDKQFHNVGEDIVEIAQDFFALLADVLGTVFRGIATA